MKITKEGIRFILASLLIAAAALNTGNNLIYLILSFMLSLALLSVVLLRVNLAGLSLEVFTCVPIFAGEEALSEIGVTNRKRFIRSFSVRVSSAGTVSPVYFTTIPHRKTVKKEIGLSFKRRGLYTYGDFRIQSGFPFILFEQEKAMRINGDVLVYPALRDVGSLIPKITGGKGGGSLRTRGAGDDMYSIREFRYGDDWRRIHWKVSAKATALLVKEYADHGINKTTIIIDNLAADYSILHKAVNGRRDEETSDEVFEEVVSLAGSLARFFLDRGHFVRVFSCKKMIPFGTGHEQLFKILDVLALIEEEDLWDCVVPHDGEGCFIGVMKSPDSPLRNFVDGGDAMIYAESL